MIVSTYDCISSIHLFFTIQNIHSIRVNFVPKPYYEDYEGLLFNEELGRVKFSL